MQTPTLAASSTMQTISAGSKWLAPIGWNCQACSVADYVQRGVLFAVVRVEIDYHISAVLGDEVEVTVEPERVRRVRFILRQKWFASVTAPSWYRPKSPSRASHRSARSRQCLSNWLNRCRT